MILIVDMNYKKASLGFYEFVSPIISIVGNLREHVVKHFSELHADEVSKYDQIVLSGTALKDQATLHHIEKFEWIKDCDKSILGICAGMQTIGLVFGLRLYECVEIGMSKITTTRENPLFSSTFKAYGLHNYSAQSSSDFDVLAESKKCVQAIKHKKKAVYGVLFHPEVRNKEILERFILLKS